MAKVEFTDFSQKFEALVMQQISANMQEVQAEYAKDMHDTLTNVPQGRYWKDAGTPFFRPASGPGPGIHRASKPGDPPTVFKGLLRDSIGSRVKHQDRHRYEGTVGTQANYAALLELGGINKGGYRIEPRPAWLPTLLYNRNKYGLIATKGFRTR